jgi:hypothetical protein
VLVELVQSLRMERLNNLGIADKIGVILRKKMPTLKDKLCNVFGKLEDKRSWRDQKHTFLNLLRIGLLDTLAGAQ